MKARRIIEASKTDLMEDIVTEGQTLVIVSTPGCAPCKNMKENVLPYLPIKVVSIDASQNIDALKVVQAHSGSITGVPVIALYEDGKFVKRQTGGMTLDEVKEFLKD